MTAYDPQTPPQPAAWLAIDESDRLDLVERYHRGTRARLPNLRLHAILHVAVENQLAAGDAVVAETLDRLLRQGLSRHEAIHAVASVLLMDLDHLAKNAAQTKDGMVDAGSYYEALHKLTAQTWRAAAADEQEPR
jgi:hypothetical protein